MSDARTRYLIEQVTEKRISALESELGAVKAELEAIKSSLVKPVVQAQTVRKTTK